MQVWLLEGLADAEPGFQVWALDHLGLASWAETRSQVLQRMPAKYEEYRTWLDHHRLGDPGPDSGVEVAEEIRGDEVLFTPDRLPATVSEIERTLRLLGASRSDLVDILQRVPVAVHDWDPPYRRFLSWGRWRTVRQVVAHLANTETHYYLTAIGFQPPLEPVSPVAEWESFLDARRAQVIEFLDDLKRSSDLIRVDPAGAWSVRKVLRRMIWHERLHTKSIRRILDEHTGRFG